MTNHPNRRRLALHHPDVEIGDVVYLIERINITTNKQWLYVTPVMPTDLNNTPKEIGSLGCYNDVSSTAKGKVEVTKWGAEVGTVMFKKVK